MATAAATRRPSGPVLTAAHYRSASPTRITLAGTAAARARSSAGHSVSVSSSPSPSSRSRRTCMCSPTNHPGSFRCSLHKERVVKPSPSPAGPHGGVHGHGKPSSPPPTTSRLGAGRRMGSALVRIGAVEGGGECARRALAATARASSPAAQHRRRVGGPGGVRARPGSRLSAVSFAGDRDGDNGHQL